MPNKMEAISSQETSSTSILLNCSTLISYLKTLPQDVLSDLYGHPATCLAVFRWVLIISLLKIQPYENKGFSIRSLSDYLTFLYLRELPPLAKQFVMRLLYVEQAVPKAVVSSWVNSHTVGSSLSQANTALSDLGVWQEASMPGGLPAWILKSTFRQNLKIVLTGG